MENARFEQAMVERCGASTLHHGVVELVWDDLGGLRNGGEVSAFVSGVCHRTGSGRTGGN